MRSPPGARVLVFGVGRSGTTWVATVLGATRGARLLLEPDNAGSGPHAVKALRGHGSTLVLGAHDRAPARYERLWEAILGSSAPRWIRGRNVVAHRLYAGVPLAAKRAAWGPDGDRGSVRLRLAVALSQPPRIRPAEPVVAKTVAGLFATGWLLGRWRPRAIWVRRHPLDVIAGRRAMAMPVEASAMARSLEAAGRMPAWCPPPPPDGSLAAQAWYTGLGMTWLRDVAEELPGVIEVSHEALCLDPERRFAELAGLVGLDWDDAAATALERSNRPGDGWSTHRVTSEQSGKWRTRLDPREQREAMDWIGRFPIADDYELR